MQSVSDVSRSTQCRVDAVKRSDSLAAVPLICQRNRIRHSVWDRLGPSMVMNLGVNGSESKLCGEKPVMKKNVDSSWEEVPQADKRQLPTVKHP
ncbi:hypothetical protein AKJ16_DCAP22066 [Drosera capensis]